MTTFLLARHAAHLEQGHRLVGRTAGIRLSEHGRSQAGALARQLETAPVTIIAASPQERARATAEVIGQHLGLMVSIDGDLDEIDYGAWTGRRPGELDGDPRWVGWNLVRSTHRAPGGESMHEVQARMVRAVERYAGRQADGAILIVSHQDPLRSLLAHWLGMPLDHLLRLGLEPGSLSTVEVTDGWPFLVSLNRVF